MKLKFNSIKKGLIIGWNKPTLPDNLIRLQLHPLIRIFRVLSGICVLLILTKRINFFNEFVLYFAVFISFLYIFYLIYINYHRVIFMYKSFKNKDLDVKNSPLDKFATLANKLIWCVKGSCDTIAPVGISLGFMAGLDSILEAKGKEAIFLPFLGDILLPNSDADKIYKERRNLFKEVTGIDRKFLELMQDKSTISSLEKKVIFLIRKI